MDAKAHPGYDLLDRLAVEVARQYNVEFKQPFFVAVGYFPDYDIVSLDRSIKVEVKCETTPIRTGNVCIEYWNTHKDRPSGIVVTTANLWVHIVLEKDGFQAYEYDVAVLRKLVIEEGRKSDNGRNSLFKLIPLDLFKKHARRGFPCVTVLASEIKEAAGIPTSQAATPRAPSDCKLDLGPTTS
jgi:hypothetical protein